MLERPWKFTILVLSLCLLAAMMLAVPFNRIAADDYCYIQKAQYLGFWASQIDFYTRWTGRMAATLHQILVGLWVVKTGKLGFYTTVSVVSLFLATLFAARPVFGRNSFVASAFLISVALYLTPNRAETIFWLAGSATYLWPASFLMIAAGILLRSDGSRLSLACLSASLTLAVTSNETVGAVLVVLAICWIGVRIRGRGLDPAVNLHRWAFVLTGSSAIVVSFSAVLFAPGNAARAANFSGPPVEFLLIRNVYITREFLDTVVSPQLAVLAAFAVIVANLMSPPKGRESDSVSTRLLVLALSALALAYLYCLPATSLFGGMPPDRGHITFYLFLLPIVVVAGRSLYPVIVHQRARYLLLGFSLFYLCGLVADRLIESERQFALAKAYAQVFDVNQAKLTGAAHTDMQVVIQALAPSGPLHLTQISRDPEHWENQCIADAFQISGGVTGL
jgi:hypothetical protein